MKSECEMSSTVFTIRNRLEPGDVGEIVRLHGVLYAREYQFDSTFEAYVAKPLAEFVLTSSQRSRIWIATRDSRIVGCIAIVESTPTVAQLRWYLVDPCARGTGLGKRLLNDAVEFCRQCGYDSIILWTVSSLAAAAHLYQAVGFEKVEANATHIWGVDVVEEKYELRLTG